MRYDDGIPEVRLTPEQITERAIANAMGRIDPDAREPKAPPPPETEPIGPLKKYQDNPAQPAVVTMLLQPSTKKQLVRLAERARQKFEHADDQIAHLRKLIEADNELRTLLLNDAMTSISSYAVRVARERHVSDEWASGGGKPVSDSFKNRHRNMLAGLRATGEALAKSIFDWRNRAGKRLGDMIGSELVEFGMELVEDQKTAVLRTEVVQAMAARVGRNQPVAKTLSVEEVVRIHDRVTNRKPSAQDKREKLRVGATARAHVGCSDE